jgi:hypothetical protein
MNRRTREFRTLFEALPASIQAIARDKFELFLLDPLNPALHNHELRDGGRGRHRPGSRAVWITQRYRALYVTEDEVNIWYWIGTHSAYNIFTGSNT